MIASVTKKTYQSVQSIYPELKNMYGTKKAKVMSEKVIAFLSFLENVESRSKKKPNGQRYVSSIITNKFFGNANISELMSCLIRNKIISRENYANFDKQKYCYKFISVNCNKTTGNKRVYIQNKTLSDLMEIVGKYFYDHRKGFTEEYLLLENNYKTLSVDFSRMETLFFKEYGVSYSDVESFLNEFYSMSITKQGTTPVSSNMEKAISSYRTVHAIAENDSHMKIAYGRCYMGFHSLKKELRTGLLLDGKPLCELWDASSNFVMMSAGIALRYIDFNNSKKEHDEITNIVKLCSERRFYETIVVPELSREIVKKSVLHYMFESSSGRHEYELLLNHFSSFSDRGISRLYKTACKYASYYDMEKSGTAFPRSEIKKVKRDLLNFSGALDDNVHSLLVRKEEEDDENGNDIPSDEECVYLEDNLKTNSSTIISNITSFNDSSTGSNITSKTNENDNHDIYGEEGVVDSSSIHPKSETVSSLKYTDFGLKGPTFCKGVISTSKVLSYAIKKKKPTDCLRYCYYLKQTLEICFVLKEMKKQYPAFLKCLEMISVSLEDWNRSQPEFKKENLSILCQRLEGQVINEKIIPKLHEQFPGHKFVSLHDAVFSTTDVVDKISKNHIQDMYLDELNKFVTGVSGRSITDAIAEPYSLIGCLSSYNPMVESIIDQRGLKSLLNESNYTTVMKPFSSDPEMKKISDAVDHPTMCNMLSQLIDKVIQNMKKA